MAKLLHLLHSFPPDSRGGIENHVEALGAAQIAAGHEVVVACGGAERPSEVGGAAGAPGAPLRIVRLGAEAERERADRAARGLESVALAAFARCLEAERPDVVHVHHFAATGPGPVVLAHRAGAATVVTLHDLHAICPLFFRLRPSHAVAAVDAADGADAAESVAASESAEANAVPPCPPEVDEATCIACLVDATGEATARVAPWFGERARAFREDLAAADAVTAPSVAIADYLRAVPLLAGLDIACVGFPRGAPPAARGRVRSRGHRPVGAPLVVATWGGLVPGKGLALLVDAAALLPAGAVELHHHGPAIDAAHAAACVTRARERGVSLTLHGPFQREELADRLADVDVAVHPSRFLETYGLTTDEAHALGLPVVVSDRGAPRERLGGRGLVFRADDAHDLARVLRELLDPEALAHLANGAPPALLPIEVYAARLDTVYARSLARRAPRPISPPVPRR